jgi:hypothetical protein
MKFFAVSTFAALSLLVGCAAPSASDSADVGQDEMTSAPKIELDATSDKNSLQAQLFNLLEAFEGDSAFGISGGNGPTVSMQGASEHGAPARSVSCNTSKLIHATVGSGVSTTSFFACTLNGFNKVRNGGELPSVVLQDNGEDPLAGKLFSLLAKGEQKGGLGVKRTSTTQHPPCCDMPITTSFAIQGGAETLSCSMVSGGFAPIRSVHCTFERNDAVDTEVKKGTLVHTVGIGGENTGFSAKIDSSTIELVLDPAAQANFVEGRVARITGTPTTLSGIETHDRPAIKVTDLLVCPAANTVLNMMPPVSADTLWISQNCPDLGDVVQ